MNSVHLIGRLATEVEVKEVSEGSKVSSFILAVDRNAEEADFALLRHWRPLTRTVKTANVKLHVKWPVRERCGEWLESIYQAT